MRPTKYEDLQSAVEALEDCVELNKPIEAIGDLVDEVEAIGGDPDISSETEQAMGLRDALTDEYEVRPQFFAQAISEAENADLDSNEEDALVHIVDTVNLVIGILEGLPG